MTRALSSFGTIRSFFFTRKITEWLSVFTLSAKLIPGETIQRARDEKLTESAVRKAIFLMGLSPRHKSFYYISMALCEYILRAESDVPKPCSDDALVRRRMERCMRYAIEYAWNVTCGDIRRLFPNSKLPPSPSEFISVMRWELADAEERK